jgi:ribonuclease HI
MKQYLVSNVIIKRDQKVLLLRRTEGDIRFKELYELPGGKVGFGEDPISCVVREIKQKLGLEITTAQLELKDVRSYVDEYDSTKQFFIAVFSMIFHGGEKPKLSPGHDKFVWKMVTDIHPNEVTDITRAVLGLVAQPSIFVDSEKVYEASDSREMLIYTDGGSRGNPGPSASGFVIKDRHENLLFEGGDYIGITTNNQAEYQAVKLALEKAIQMGGRSILLRLDSQLVANQLNGVYQIRNRDLWPVYANIKILITKFDSIVFEHVRRELNKEADAMVNKILDARAI